MHLSWLRGVGVRQVRITCGLVMFSYIFSHFFNHALGNISYGAMEWWRLNVHIWWWRIPVVNDALYTAATIHLSLGLWALYQRRHFRYTAIEITQLSLGLSIPLLLCIHFGSVRVSGWMYGVPPLAYQSVLYAFWVTRPYMMIVQFTLLTVAWTHACIGLYFWLRLKPLFKMAWPLFFAIAILLPPLAMLGASHGARDVIALAKDPEWRAANLKVLLAGEPRANMERVSQVYFPLGYLSAIALVFLARGVRVLRERRRGMITVTYPTRQVKVPKGLSVLEASLRYNVPHASVCGGRARCSTCRVRVVSDCHFLPTPSGREAFVLDRIGVSADPSVRLACQLRPQTDISLIPILPPHVDSNFVRNRQRINIGEERHLVMMFVDMRGSTGLAEARLPYDVVFVMNRFVDAASRGVADAGGHPNQFLGDGIMALFGLNTDLATACRQALQAAALIAANVAHLNHLLATEISAPIQYGIGIHSGEVILGHVGFRNHTVLAALGDSTNVAARLQDLSKSMNCAVVISDDVCRMGGLQDDALTRAQVTIRGRDQPMLVRTEKDPRILPRLLVPTTPDLEQLLTA
jgi:adenylate cyclase